MFCGINTLFDNNLEVADSENMCIVSPINLQHYRTFRRSKFKFKTCRDQQFVVHLYAGKLTNVRLRCIFMGLTIE